MAWVLLEEFNAYDQYGSYFRTLWAHKPTALAIARALVELESKDQSPKTLQEQYKFRKEYFDELAAHLLTGGGRRGNEDSWYLLEEHRPRSPVQ